MDSPLLSSCSLILAIASLLLFYFNLWRTAKNQARLLLPPGPPTWPIVGNLFQPGKRPHESLCALSQQYGPLMILRLGLKTTVVVSSPSMAKEVLKTHDHVFAGRTVLEAAKVFSHHKSSMIWGEYGPHWRFLRRISTAELFSPRRLDALQHLRRDQVFRTIRQIFEDKGKAVNIGHTVFCTSLNLLGNMIFSTTVLDPHNPASVGFKDVIWQTAKLGGTPNVVDFFPFLGFLDPQGLARQMAKHFKGLYDFFDLFIQNRLATRSKNIEQKDSDKDFLDVLLDFRSEDFTLVDVRALIVELFMAGTETTTTTIEWAMAEFIRNPQKMQCAQRELDEVVGDKRRVEESDIHCLPYLHAAVKEIFRLHPTAPLLLPHKAESSCEIEGFVIPKHSQVMVNVWAIGRDPAMWKEPLEFIPERFLEFIPERFLEFIPERFLEGENSKIDYKGQNFELIPFGAGRRICAGLPLASRMVNYVLASLLHSFEWTLPDGMRCEHMDMADEFGLTLKKGVELNAIPTPRLPHCIY